MSVLRQIGDFFQWMVEVCTAPPARPLPPHALGVSDGEPVIFRLAGADYIVERAATAQDAAPLFLSDNNALKVTFEVTGEAMTWGQNPARIEAAKRCPFPLDQAHSSLTRQQKAWEGGAPWLFIAAQRTRLQTIKDSVQSIGAKPGLPFVTYEGSMIALAPHRRPWGVIVSGTIAAIAAVVAIVAVNTVDSGRIQAAQDRLNTARAALNAAEAQATAAAAARTKAAAPIEAARAVDALLAANPAVAATLAALSEATPDTAHLQRLSIRVDTAEGEFIAPDAAALASEIGRHAAFASARLKTAARVEPQTGLQRATLEIRKDAAQ